MSSTAVRGSALKIGSQRTAPVSQPVPRPEFVGYRIAAIVPCHNEAAAIGKVVRDLRNAVPTMEIYVYDNRSTDDTASIAREAGAVVRHEHSKGKGNVVRRAFADIDADVYLLIDGDDTYDANAAPELIKTLISGPFDHVLGCRKPEPDSLTAYRPAHQWGNRVLNRIVGAVFGEDMGDMLSGYRAFSRRFVKSFPAVSREFEIETELTVHSLALRVPTASVEVGFRDRALGTESKLRTMRDGFKILSLIANLTRHERPLSFYGVWAAAIGIAAITLGIATANGGAPEGADALRLPQVALALGLTSALIFVTGLVLDGIRKTRHEFSRLTYLSHPAPQTPLV